VAGPDLAGHDKRLAVSAGKDAEEASMSAVGGRSPSPSKSALMAAAVADGAGAGEAAKRPDVQVGGASPSQLKVPAEPQASVDGERKAWW